jgi:hypothetical protein
MQYIMVSNAYSWKGPLIAIRLEGAEYAGHSLSMVENRYGLRVALRFHAEKEPSLDREVAVV